MEHINYKAEGIPLLLLFLLAILAVRIPAGHTRLRNRGKTPLNIVITGATGGLGGQLIKLFQSRDNENVNLILVDKDKSKF